MSCVIPRPVFVDDLFLRIILQTWKSFHDYDYDYDYDYDRVIIVSVHTLLRNTCCSHHLSYFCSNFGIGTRLLLLRELAVSAPALSGGIEF